MSHHEEKRYFESDFEPMFVELEREIDIATGGDQPSQARFPGFYVHQDVKVAMTDAVEAFRRRDFHWAGKRLAAGMDFLQHRQRQYFKFEIEKYFVAEIKQARGAGVAKQDLDRMEKLVEEMNLHWKSKIRFNLDIAGQLYRRSLATVEEIRTAHFRKKEKKEKEEAAAAKKKQLDAQAAEQKKRDEQRQADVARTQTKADEFRERLMKKKLFGAVA